MRLRHQYVLRRSGEPVEERFCGDPVVSFLYARVREDAGWMYRALTSARLTTLAAMMRFDRRPHDPGTMRRRYALRMGLDFSECVESEEALDTPRKVFERKIRYWDCRPMEPNPHAVVSPADARLLVGSLSADSVLNIKHKFFELEELLGAEGRWALPRFQRGEWAIARLTPDKYHYTHAPVSGRVRAFYELDGRYQSCHPAVVIAQATPFSKNRRVVTLIDTDLPGGTEVGLVAMVEIVALMIGDIASCYSVERYENPQPIQPGMWVKRGAPKALFRPGSSTVVLMFEPGRVAFCADLVQNQQREDVCSAYYSRGMVRPLVETDVRVRSTIAYARRRSPA